MHHLEIEHQERNNADFVARVRKRATEIMAKKSEEAMKPLRRREPIVDDYNEQTYRENIRVKDEQFSDLTAEPKLAEWNGMSEKARQHIREYHPSLAEHLSQQANDPVHHPKHYCQGGTECIDVLEQLAADGHDFRILNAMKYLWRYRYKGGDESLRKAVWYINRVLNNG